MTNSFGIVDKGKLIWEFKTKNLINWAYPCEGLEQIKNSNDSLLNIQVGSENMEKGGVWKKEITGDCTGDDQGEGEKWER